jgi:phosphoglycolate phosphatase
MTDFALIFDLDGTLVDTAPDLLGALNAVLVKEGRRPAALADMRHLVGFGARTLMVEAFKMTGGPAEPERIEDLRAAFLSHYRDHIADTSRLFPGVEETLDAFRAEGARMGILTNKPQELTVLLMAKLGLDKYFAAIFGQGRMPYTKPDARIFQDVVRETGGTGAGALMIGDSITDVQTARAGRAPVILVSYGYTPVPARTLGADAVVDDFREVPDAVRRLLGTG